MHWAGIRVVAGAKVVLQLHYNLKSAGSTSDLTEVDFQVESKVDHEAAFAPWLRAAWAMDPDTMKIPAGQKQVIHQYREDPRGFFETVTGGIDLSEGFDVHSVLLHMHLLGVSGEGESGVPCAVELVEPAQHPQPGGLQHRTAVV